MLQELYVEVVQKYDSWTLWQDRNALVFLWTFVKALSFKYKLLPDKHSLKFLK